MRRLSSSYLVLESSAGWRFSMRPMFKTSLFVLCYVVLLDSFLQHRRNDQVVWSFCSTQVVLSYSLTWQITQTLGKQWKRRLSNSWRTSPDQGPSLQAEPLLKCFWVKYCSEFSLQTCMLKSLEQSIWVLPIKRKMMCRSWIQTSDLSFIFRPTYWRCVM